MGQMADIRLGDLTTTLGRYRPAFAAVGIIAVVAIALPGGATAGDGAATTFDPGFASNGTATAPFDGADAPVVPAPAGGLTAAAPLFDVAPSSSLTTSFAPTGAPFTSGAPSGGAFVASPSPTQNPSGPPTSSDGGGFDFEPQPTIEAPTTLRIIESLWATLAAGTPVGSAGVPEAGLPVGTRLGETDKASYIRLEGSATTLSLVEAAEGQRQAAGAVLQACAISDGAWAAGEGASFDDAPAVDAEACAPGTRADDGTWSFDLSALGDPAATTGFALLPGPDAPIDFQVTFSAAG